MGGGERVGKKKKEGGVVPWLGLLWVVLGRVGKRVLFVDLGKGEGGRGKKGGRKGEKGEKKGEALVVVRYMRLEVVGVGVGDVVKPAMGKFCAIVFSFLFLW